MKEISKILLISLFISLFISQSRAQIYFNNIYDIPQYQVSTSVLENTGYFSIGQEITTTYRSMFFIQTDLNGDTLWTKNYPRNQYAYYSGLSNSLIKTYDNSYAFGGTFINLMDTTNAGDCLLVKLTTIGDTIFTKKYGGNQLDIANTLLQSNDSGYVLIGSTSSFGNGLSDFYMVKTDSLGNFEWQRTFGTSASEEALSGEKTLDGGYILSGKESNLFYVAKTDVLGNIEWQYPYGGTIGGCFIKQLPDSSYILAGAEAVGGLGDQACLLKIDKNGGFLWKKNYGGTTDDWLYSVPLILAEGSIIVAGQTTVAGIPYGILLKTDSLGNQQWLRQYFKNPVIDNYFYDVKHTSDNGFVMCGQTYSTLTDSWLVKVDSNGCEVANCNVGINEFENSNSRLEIYPNPTKEIVDIQIRNADFKDYEISICNILGEKVIAPEILSEKMNVSHFQTGIYFVTAISKKTGNRLTATFIKQ